MKQCERCKGEGRIHNISTFPIDMINCPNCKCYKNARRNYEPSGEEEDKK
jgi:hypothetical protein